MAIGTTAALLGLGIAGASAGASALGSRNAANASREAGQVQSVAGERAATDSLAAGQTAADQALEAQRRAAAGMAGSTNAANDQITAQLQAILEANGPYSAAGQDALRQLAQLYGDGGAYAQGFDPNSVDLNADPGMKFRFEQGQRGIEATAAARGSVLSSRAQKEVARFNSNLASQEYGNAFNRAFDVYKDARTARTGVLKDLVTTGQNSTIDSNRARTLAGAGISENMTGAAKAIGDWDTNASQYAGKVMLDATGQAGDFRTGAAASRAAGGVGAANAWNQGIGQAIGGGLGAYSIYEGSRRR